MAVYDHTPASAGFTGRGMLHRAIAGFHRWNDLRRTRNALNKLSDHELEDIGLCRGDLGQSAESRLIR